MNEVLVLESHKVVRWSRVNSAIEWGPDSRVGYWDMGKLRRMNRKQAVQKIARQMGWRLAEARALLFRSRVGLLRGAPA